jgi:hypothetical protein
MRSIEPPTETDQAEFEAWWAANYDHFVQAELVAKTVLTRNLARMMKVIARAAWMTSRNKKP